MLGFEADVVFCGCVVATGRDIGLWVVVSCVGFDGSWQERLATKRRINNIIKEYLPKLIISSFMIILLNEYLVTGKTILNSATEERSRLRLFWVAFTFKFPFRFIRLRQGFGG